MSARRVTVAVVAGLLVAAAVADAQDVLHSPPPGVVFTERLFAGIALVHDNDNLPHPGNTLRDDNYSAAYELRVNGRIVEAARLTAPLSALDRLTGLRRAHARGARRYHAAQLIGIVYTPDRIQTAEVQTDDRPYASLIALTVSRTSVAASLDRAWWSMLSVGMLGLQTPGDMQRLIHRTRRWMTGRTVPVDPLGWGNQISAGGEPTALYRVGYQQRFAGDGGPGRRKHWEVAGALEGAAGYAVTASGALVARLGAFTSEFWEFPRGVASPAAGQQDPPADGARRWDVMAFALVRPRVVAYDAILQGQFRHSVFTVRPRHLIGEWEGGVGASLPLGTHQLQVVVQFAQGRTADFVGPRARNYTWGTVGLFLSNRRPGS